MRPGARGHGRAGARLVVAAAVVAVPVGPCAPVSAAAQDNPAIRAAVSLAADGRGDSARRIVAGELAKAQPGSPAYVEALFWRGRLATSGDSAGLDFRRVAIEYSTSRWADQALLQLAQLAMAAGKPADALQDARRIRNDYPGSPWASRAALWAGRAAFEIGDPTSACAFLDSARQEAAGDVELANQVAFYRSRCSAVLAAAPPPGRPQAATRADSAAAAARGDTARQKTPPAAAPPHPTPFEVQVTATRSGRAARAMLDRVKKAGFEARIVTGTDGYQRVRAGPFPARGDAEAAAARLRRALGGHPVVVPSP